MKTIIALLTVCFYALSSHAQFCITKKGSKQAYEAYDCKEEKTTSCMGIIDQLPADGTGTLFHQSIFSIATNPEEESSIANQSAFAVDAEGNTQLIVMSRKDVAAFMIETLQPELSGKKCKKAIEELVEKADGDENLSIPLRKDAIKDLRIKDSEIRYRQGITNFTMRLEEAAYEGFEEVTTPAGTFNCLKITYKLSLKSPMLSESTFLTEWYAEQIGLVKQVKTNKKGAPVSRLTLQRIDN